MRKKFFGSNLDFFGFSASMLCAVHCMALPLVMTAGALSGLAWLHEPWIEAIFIGLSLALASWSLLRGYLLHHQHLSAIQIVAIGFILLILSRFVEHDWEPLLAALGGMTIAGAHWKNWQLQTRHHHGQEKCTRCV